jgi:putative transposase
VYYYKAITDPTDVPIQDMLSGLAEGHRRWGFWKMYDFIRQQAGKPWNHKRVYRIYTRMQLNLRRKAKKRLPVRNREAPTLPIAPNVVWSMDFMHDRLANSRPFRALTIIDDYNREALNITIDSSISSQRVARELNHLISYRGKPQVIRVDNGPEFLALEQWCKDNQIELKFIQPAKPNQNAFIERFNRTYRQDVLSQHLFEDLDQVREFTARFIWEYNNLRSHDSLQNLTPRAFLLKYGKLSVTQIEAEFPTFQLDGDDDNFLLSRVAN